jgi:hypothetical protein
LPRHPAKSTLLVGIALILKPVALVCIDALGLFYQNANGWNNGSFPIPSTISKENGSVAEATFVAPFP